MPILNKIATAAGLGAIVISLQAFAEEKHIVMGAGPSMIVARLFFDQISQSTGSEYVFDVDRRSIKHAGGVQSSDTHLFGRTGRPLNEAERLQNKKEIVLARIPVAIVAGSKAGVRKLTLAQLEGIFSRKIHNWREVGGADHPIVLVGRESAEAAFSVLKRDHAFFRGAMFDETLTRDHQVVNFMGSSNGDYAIGFGAKPNFDALPILLVEGFDSSLSVGLVYDAKHENHPLVESAKSYAKGSAWYKTVKQTGFYPPE